MGEMIPDNQGRIRVISVTTPAVGDDFSHTQDIRTRWRIMSVKCRFVAAAVAVDRLVILTFGFGGNVYLKCHHFLAITTGQTWELSWVAVGRSTAATGGRVSQATLPEMFLVNNQMVIASETIGIDAADQFSEIFIMVEEWIEPLA